MNKNLYHKKYRSLPSRSAVVAALVCSSLLKSDEKSWSSGIEVEPADPAWEEDPGFESGSPTKLISHLSLAGLILLLLLLATLDLAWFFLELLLELLAFEELNDDEEEEVEAATEELFETPALVLGVEDWVLGAEQWQVENPLKKHTEHWMAIAPSDFRSNVAACCKIIAVPLPFHEKFSSWTSWRGNIVHTTTYDQQPQFPASHTHTQPQSTEKSTACWQNV